MAALNVPSKAVVDVKNAGVVATTYTVTLGSCTYPIAAVPPQSVTLTPGQASEVVLQVPQNTSSCSLHYYARGGIANMVSLRTIWGLNTVAKLYHVFLL